MDDDTKSGEKTEKHTYEAPRLIVYGTVEDLALNTNSGSADGMQGGSAP